MNTFKPDSNNTIYTVFGPTDKVIGSFTKVKEKWEITFGTTKKEVNFFKDCLPIVTRYVVDSNGN